MATLFEKVKIGNVELKNRMVMCPMGYGSPDADGGISDHQIEYYVERAKGGYGLIFTSGQYVTGKFEKSESNFLETPRHGQRLSLLANKLHQYGAKLAVQLTIGLGRVSFIDPFTAPKSSSNNPSFWFTNLTCEPYTTEEVKWLVDKLGYSALLAKNAGADMVELHAYGGYLIDQFLSANWNNRTDEYGGSPENRMRILFELRDSIWKYCGKNYPIAIKITPDHHFDGGRTLEEGIEMVKMLDNEGFCLLHIDMGTYENWFNAVTTCYQEEGLQLYIAEALKKAGIKTPFLVQGKLNSPKLAEKVVADGLAELIGHGHQSIADPHWPRKAKTGAFNDIIPCIGCNECIYAGFTNKWDVCSVNPTNNSKEEYELTPATEKQSILVVGGGPGGMMAAITAAKRGYDVELWEKDYTLGGTLKAAGAPYFKNDTKKYMEHLIAQVNKHDIKVRLAKAATLENILEKNPDVVILAGGSKPIIPNLNGNGKGHILEATDLLSNGGITGHKIVVLGGGLVGCETALQLDSEDKDVTIVEMLDQLLLTAVHAPNNDMAIKDMIAKSNIKVMTGTKLTAVYEDKVKVSIDGEEKEVPCDTLVLAVGYKADTTLSDSLEQKGKRVFKIGDNVKAGKIIDAVQQGFHTVRLLEELV
ncbi:NAD(P)/FAD-dependent oxidoreductase [Clostridium ljungdahlii]|uniref:2-enoate reductase FldZ n=1 Tax=Clostridium ljungdahlii TaxID=1538 RepID=A0A166RGV2_9CLOT|nr:NAD(P)/FAD-dependent oxidoreductase [Clostridium ljungdahlii]OAA90788.1 2-enoate reductase FldZ [Clostridium ljungdahlii]